ncbi:hypothetical protein SynBMKMC1_01160 [Synechococcus sp. BMK-MC-1]|nr:hypothetical protein SynBMKMC1_01160 [Synechococcus sp. BMK-MC-1]
MLRGTIMTLTYRGQTYVPNHTAATRQPVVLVYRGRQLTK